MKRPRPEQVRAVFDAAMERSDDERRAFVATICADDAALQEEVLALLSALESPANTLETHQGAFDLDDVSPSEGSDVRGIHVADFTIHRRIGRGGAGSVFEAEQTSPQRRVALKLLHSWTASREARRRFVEEANILGRLQHPSIAQIFAAGKLSLADSGESPHLTDLFEDVRDVPWIAMELIEGARTLHDYADAFELDQTKRLALFLNGCDAVHHGHTRGVIHRDLKPQNVLVSAIGEVKVIDFGVARAMETVGKDAEAHRVTSNGAIIGTLRYMSPEQCDGRANTADTRSDVYALGVMLFELLTKSPPYELSGQSFTAAVRTICEASPMSPRGLVPHLDRDLETIILKCLQKDPARRYQAVGELASDLRRFMDRLPILARPATTIYRLSMLARRRPLGTALALLAMLSVIAGVAGLGVGLSRERAARQESESRREQADRQAWYANLFAADSAIRNGDGSDALKRLNAIPAARRGWEWNYLAHCADWSDSQWRVTQEPAHCFPSPDGSLIAAKTDAGNLEVYDATTRRLEFTIEHIPLGGSCRWSRDGSTLAAFGVGGVLIVARSNPADHYIIPLPKASVGDGGWSPDGSTLCVGCAEEGGVYLIRVDTRAIVKHIAAVGWICDVDFSPDGKLVAYVDGRDVVLINSLDGSETRRIPIDRQKTFDTNALRFSPDGRVLAVSSEQTVYLFNPDGGQRLEVLRGHTQRILSVNFDPTSRYLVTAAFDKTIRVWDLQKTSAEPVTLLGHESPLVNAEFVPDAAGAVSICSTDEHATVRRWRPFAAAPRSQAAVEGSREYVRQVQFSPRGDKLASFLNDALSMWSIGERSEFESTTFVPGQRILIAHDFSYYAGIRDGNCLFKMSALTRQVVWQKLLTASPHAGVVAFAELCLSPDGSIVAVGVNGGMAILFRTSDGEEIGRIDMPCDAINFLAISPDNRLLVLRSNLGKANLYDMSSLRLIRSLTADGDIGFCVAFSPDGSMLAYADRIDGLSVMNVATSAIVSKIRGVGSQPWSVAFSPDNQRLGVGARDRATHLYETASGDELLQLRNHTGSVMSLQWSPNGRLLATGGYDQRVVVYHSMP